MGVMVKVDGPRLQRIRLSRGLTQQELEKSARLNTCTIGRLERTRGPASITTVRKLAKALEVHVVELVVMSKPWVGT